MEDAVLLPESSVDLLQDTVDIVRKAGLFGLKSGLAEQSMVKNYSMKGYLCQSISRGQEGLCSIYVKDPIYKTYKIDLAGVIYTNYPDLESKFQLRFYKEGATWFDTDPLTVDNLTCDKIIAAIDAQGQIRTKGMLADLGHPFSSTELIPNEDLYPEVPSDYKPVSMLQSKMGSWVISFLSADLPEGFDIDLLFTVSSSDPIQLSGPAVMTLHEISDRPLNEYTTVTDCLDLASPTPLRGGTKVILSTFEDVGLGIIAANPREYFFEEQYKAS